MKTVCNTIVHLPYFFMLWQRSNSLEQCTPTTREVWEKRPVENRKSSPNVINLGKSEY